MYSIEQIGKVNFEFERDSRSIFSLPSENKTIKLINSMIANILNSDFKSDFEENMTDNYVKETLIDNIFDEQFHQIEEYLIKHSFDNALNIFNAIFYLLEYFTAWINEPRKNHLKQFFSDLCFYLNCLIISYFSLLNIEIKNENFKITVSLLKNLISEIDIFDVYLKENFNIKLLTAIKPRDFNTLSYFSIENLVEYLKDLESKKLKADGYCFRYINFNANDLIFKPDKFRFYNFDSIGKYYLNFNSYI